MLFKVALWPTWLQACLCVYVQCAAHLTVGSDVAQHLRRWRWAAARCIRSTTHQCVEFVDRLLIRPWQVGKELDKGLGSIKLSSGVVMMVSKRTSYVCDGATLSSTVSWKACVSL